METRTFVHDNTLTEILFEHSHNPPLVSIYTIATAVGRPYTTLQQFVLKKGIQRQRIGGMEMIPISAAQDWLRRARKIFPELRQALLEFLDSEIGSTSSVPSGITQLARLQSELAAVHTKIKELRQRETELKETIELYLEEVREELLGGDE